jgi:hypothetical protein
MYVTNSNFNACVLACVCLFAHSESQLSFVCSCVRMVRGLCCLCLSIRVLTTRILRIFEREYHDYQGKLDEETLRERARQRETERRKESRRRSLQIEMQGLQKHPRASSAPKPGSEERCVLAFLCP